MEALAEARLDQMFSPWDRPDAPGCAVAIYRDGELVYGRGFGAADLEHGVSITTGTVFHVASISKQVTALVVALLARDGLLSLEDDLAAHVPELRLAETVTLRQVLHHSGGLRDQWDLLRLAGWRHEDLKTTGDVLRLASRQRALNFTPGTRFQYVNTGYTLLAVVVERVTGVSLGEQARRQIFEPLGMHGTSFDELYGRPVPGRARAYARTAEGGIRTDLPAYEIVGPTGLLSTVEDFARWERNFLAPTVGDRELVAAMVRPGSLTAGRRCAYGMGLALGEHRGLATVEHAGGDAGFRAHYLRVPAERFAVAVFCNASDMKPGRLARDAADVCLAGRFPDGEDPADAGRGAFATGRAVGIAAPEAAELAGRAGLYRDGASGMTCRIEPRGGRLFLLASGAEYELLPVDDGRFRFLDVDAECLFEPAGTDRSDRLTVWSAGEETGRCERVEAGAEVSADALAAWVGTYESEELEMRYTIEPEGETILLRRPRFPPASLRPVSADELAADGDGIHLRVSTGEDGAVDGFLLSTERVWNVRFQRV